MKLGVMFQSGLLVVFGIILIIIQISFLPGLFTSTTAVLNDGNISNFVGAEPTIQAIPTFVSLAILIIGIGSMGLGVFLGGREVYNNFR
jgi:hypothetical protein